MTFITSIGLVHAAAAALEMPASASWVPSEPVAVAVDLGFDMRAEKKRRTLCPTLCEEIAVKSTTRTFAERL